ncbi:hypothetical protein AQUCO_04900123v1 [Aquilegia coerulea]|uniref:ENT domain-containing protein n=1 Tax=Aquilegia coerulea TaxID=218851 RepID=A0A2G5CJZ8_AQUCA|nr:hypothetical protein AQUCO_04900123v1 [Aquilegia coerulea]PIA31604.1 hypothetical protein AQUCO_04900123v1 [Aquilegia coerulea]
MRLKRGSKLEVLKSNDKCDSWFPGTFISEDKYKCTVRYDLYLNCEGDHVVEEVYKEDVRPNPPPVKKGEKWVVGDTAEVFDLHCWRVGKVVKLLNNDRCVIRLSGSIQLKEFQRSNLRVRQAWQNNKWVVIQKVGELTINNLKLNTSNNSQGWSCTAQEHGYKDVGTRENGRQGNVKTLLPVRNLKRKHESNLKSPSQNMDVKKGRKEMKTSTKAGGYDLLPAGTSPLLRQVDVASSLQKNMGKKCMIRSTMDVETKKTNNLHPYYIMPVCATEESNECSVASCSTNGPLEYPSRHFRKSNYVSSCSDAESSSTSESERKSLTSYDEVEIEANIHKLELHAYRLTMKALYASGPLSWEQESLLTNLRLSLHISNEEHLLHLRQLLSSQVL